MVNRAAIDKLFDDITDPSLLTYIAMKLEIATDNSDNDHQSDDLGDWSNIDAVRGEQEWNSESEEHHDRDVWHDGGFFGDGGVILSEDDDTHDTRRAGSNADYEESNAGDDEDTEDDSDGEHIKCCSSVVCVNSVLP